MEITFLGTSSMVPTKKRNHSAILLEHHGEGVLLDCGEGTQRQLKLANIAATKVTRICLSHWHGDHVLGLPGLIQTLGGMAYSGTLHIYGVPGSKKYFDHMFKGFANHISIKIQIHEVEEGKVFETDRLIVECLPLQHSVPCIGFSVIEKDKRRMRVDYLRKEGVPDGPHLKKLGRGEDIEWKGKKISAEDATYIAKGRKFSYVPDTKLCANASLLAKDADVVATECTHSEDVGEKTGKYMHLTATHAATIADKANAKKLYLTHFSQRYDRVDPLVAEARKVFKETDAAEDFMQFTIPKPE